MACMINNKVLMIISSKFHRAELIGNNHFVIYGKIKKKYLRTPPPLKNIHGWHKPVCVCVQLDAHAQNDCFVPFKWDDKIKVVVYCSFSTPEQNLALFHWSSINTQRAMTENHNTHLSCKSNVGLVELKVWGASAAAPGKRIIL